MMCVLTCAILQNDKKQKICAILQNDEKIKRKNLRHLAERQELGDASDEEEP